MTQQIGIPLKATEAQTRSSDPKACVWVSANAGSGKTHVLTQRVIRLLLRGTPPTRILCLTYTKAAAANMQSRIFNRLAEWILLDDGALGTVLESLENAKPDSLKLSQARRLFACALETPGGLKIQTIHAFCESLLHQFPLEANIAGHFSMMDDSKREACIADIKKQLFTDIYRQPKSRLAQAFHTILDQAGEEALHKLLKEALIHEQNLSGYSNFLSTNGNRFFASIFGLTNLYEQAKNENTDIKTVLTAEIKRNILWHNADLQSVSQSGGSRTADFIAKIKKAEKETGNQLLDTLRSAYFKTDDSAKDPAWLFGKKTVATMPHSADAFSEKAVLLQSYIDKWNSVSLAEINCSAYILIQDLLTRFRAAKRAQGVLDFSDLISRTLSLLKRQNAGLWVQYKLDQGIDHILVDEAQDTGPEQWEIIRLLSQDFFSGLGAREDLTRTLFAVGDEKQSIYSFQGAAPQDFAQNGRYIANKASNANMLFRHESLEFSFRSAPQILTAVDETFSTPQNYRGLSANNTPPLHSAIRLNQQGYVDIWPPFGGEKAEEPQDWTVGKDSAADPAGLCADTVTALIALWLNNNEFLAGKNRPLRAGDIMILVRKRGAFIHNLTRALKNKNIPVAGADRILLTDHIAVQDLTALGNFVLQPRDDLSLACVLKSPLFQIDEKTLQILATGRKSTLFAALEHAVENNSLPEAQPLLINALEKLRSYRAFADIQPVYEFYDKVLTADGGRKRFLAQLGNSAADILDAFSEYCLSAQKTALPGLQNFLYDLSKKSPEIKRELDQNRDEIRIMTVHAAKGLEAPVVFLVDGGSAVWHSSHAPSLLPISIPENYRKKMAAAETMRLWLPKSDYKTTLTKQILDTIKQAAEEEYHRLLYVAMTRAEYRLIVCGYHGAKPQDTTWLPLVANALRDKAQTITCPVTKLQILRHSDQEGVPAAAIAGFSAQKNDPAPSFKNITLPLFLTQKPEHEPALPRPLIASGAASYSIETDIEQLPDIMPASPVLSYFTSDGISESGKANNVFSVDKGIYIHELLQYLPDIAPNLRRNIAEKYLSSRLGNTENTALMQKILQNVFAVLDNKNFSDLFGKASRAETSLQGIITIKGKQRQISARIDRLAIFDNHILFADYKTGYTPQAEKNIPAVYKMQMALYTALLHTVYPQKNIQSALIYTDSGRIFPFLNADILLKLLI